MPVWKLSCSGSCLELYKDQLFVGRDNDCDLTVKHKGIDIRHAVLNYDQRLGVFRLTDLGSSYGTFVNGESVCEESVPLYVGTRIMFGRNPMVWSVEVGEPNPKQLPQDNIQQVSLQQARRPVAPYSPPEEPRPGGMSHSFQTPGYSSLERELSCSSRDNSFVPTEVARSSVGYSDSSFSERAATVDTHRAPIETPTPDRGVDTQQTNTNSNSNTNTEIRLPTRARTLYGQPSWWGDGSDAFVSPPLLREDKPDTPHPNKAVDPPDFSQPPLCPHKQSYTDTVLDSASNKQSYAPLDSTTHKQSYTDTVLDSATHKQSYTPLDSTTHKQSYAPLDSTTHKQSYAPLDSATHKQSYTPLASVSDRESRVDRDSFVTQDIQTVSGTVQRDTGAKEKERERAPPLRRCGSYEIPLNELDPHLSRPIIEPDPVFSTPYSGSRRSEVFTVEFGESKSESRKPPGVRAAYSEPRVLFRDSNKHTTRERDNPKSKVKLAFRETEPSFQTADPPDTGLDSCSDPELRFLTPKQVSESPDNTDSLLSDRGDTRQIGDPVTSSTPISGASGQDTPESSYRKAGRRVAWQQEREESEESSAAQSASEVARRVETSLDSVFTRAMSLHGLLNRHFGSSIVPLPNFSPPKDSTNKELDAIDSLRQMEGKVENFSLLLESINLKELQEALEKLQGIESSDFSTPEAPTHDSAVRRGSFDSGIILSQTERHAAPRSTSQTSLTLKSGAKL